MLFRSIEVDCAWTAPSSAEISLQFAPAEARPTAAFDKYLAAAVDQTAHLLAEFGSVATAGRDASGRVRIDMIVRAGALLNVPRRPADVTVSTPGALSALIQHADNAERSLLAKILEAVGVRVTVVDGPVEALEQLRLDYFDLAVLDADLGRGAKETARRMRLVGGRDLTLVALHALAVGCGPQGGESEFDATLGKPLAFEQIIDVVLAAADRRARREDARQTG